MSMPLTSPVDVGVHVCRELFFVGVGVNQKWLPLLVFKIVNVSQVDAEDDIDQG